MTDTKFTPGPWAVKKEGEKWLWVGPASWVKRICRVVLYNGTEREDKANAHLIAAAPDLYEALEEQSKYHWGEYKYHAEMCASMQASEHLWRAEEIDAALAKARGDHSSSG